MLYTEKGIIEVFIIDEVIRLGPLPSHQEIRRPYLDIIRGSLLELGTRLHLYLAL